LVEVADGDGGCAGVIEVEVKDVETAVCLEG